MRPFSSIRAAHYRLLAALWTIGIVVAVSVPTGSIPGGQSLFGFDKIVHVGLFVGFGLLWLRGLCPPEGSESSISNWRAVLLFLAGSLFAIGTEVYQHLVLTGRMGDPYDAAADLAGLLVAFGSYYAYRAVL